MTMISDNTAIQEDHIGLDVVCYRIRCITNNRRYIGITNFIDRRLKSHFSLLRAGRHNCKSLQTDYDLYGIDSFTSEIIYQAKFIDSSQKKIIEKIALSVEKNLYNTNKFTDFKRSGKITTDQTLKWNIGDEIRHYPVNTKSLYLIYDKIRRGGVCTINIPDNISSNRIRAKIFSAYNTLYKKSIITDRLKTSGNFDKSILSIKFI